MVLSLGVQSTKYNCLPFSSLRASRRRTPQTFVDLLRAENFAFFAADSAATAARQFRDWDLRIAAMFSFAFSIGAISKILKEISKIN